MSLQCHFVRSVSLKQNIPNKTFSGIFHASIFTKLAEVKQILGGNCGIHFTWFFFSKWWCHCSSVHTQWRQKKVGTSKDHFIPLKTGFETGNVYFLFTDCRGRSLAYSKLVFSQPAFLKWLAVIKTLIKLLRYTLDDDNYWPLYYAFLMKL